MNETTSHLFFCKKNRFPFELNKKEDFLGILFTTRFLHMHFKQIRSV